MHILSFPRTPSARALRGASPTERPTHAWFMRPPFNLGGDTFDIFPRQSRRRLSLQSLHPSCSWGELRDTAMGTFFFFLFFFKDISALCDVTDDGTEIAISKLLFLLIRKKAPEAFFPFLSPPDAHDWKHPATMTMTYGHSQRRYWQATVWLISAGPGLWIFHIRH